MRVLLSWVLLTLACALPAPASAETRALLIGVSDYDETIGLADLRGPANDVRLLADTLRGRGITDIALLADGLEGAARPTRAAILEAFSTLARTAQPGDFIYIHMSGHGTRQSDPEGDETDALDEVFLPADTARAEAGSNAIPNAIVDDEIGRALAAIRRTGADVWLVLDSCHSGSGTRAGSPRTAVRFVDPALLGIVAPVKPRAEAAVLDPTPEDLPGGFLAFYSAQSNELAREVDFGTGEGGEAWYGLFTAKLAARLQSSEGLSFRQLFQAVLSDMNDTTVPGGARLQTPLWEGNLIDAAVFGGRDTAGLRRFALAGDTLQAGLVHGIAEGTLLGLVADPADPAQAVIAHAQAVGVTAREAGLRAVTEACVPRAEAPCEAGPPLPATARFAQVIGQPLDTVIRFAHPRDFASGALLPETDPLAAALRSAVESLSGTAMAPTPDAFDIEVVADAGALWFGAQQSLGTQPTGLSWRPDGTADLAALLTRIAEAETLARVLMNVSESGSLLNPSPITVEALRFSAPIEALATPGAQVSPRSECRQALATRRDTALRPLPRAAELKQCDSLDFSVQASLSGLRDVNRIHIDAQYCVHVAHERVEGIRNASRLGPGMVMCSDCPGGYSAGLERLFVLVTDSRDNAEPLNLEGLIETCAAEGATRGSSAAEAARGYLEALGRRPDTRGAFGSFGISDIWVEAWQWRVLPRRDAFLRAGRAVDAGGSE